MIFDTRVTRTLYSLGELTLCDPSYSGPQFDMNKITKEVQAQVLLLPQLVSSLHDQQGGRRKSAEKTDIQTSSINSIFANLMQVTVCH